jgi:CRP-like cAMP-binding protein
MEFAPGEPVIARNGPVDSLYVILGGAARAIDTPTAPLLGIGDYFGARSILDGGRHSANVLAVGELHVMRLPGRLFVELAERSPSVVLGMLRDLGARFRRLEPEPRYRQFRTQRKGSTHGGRFDAGCGSRYAGSSRRAPASLCGRSIGDRTSAA